MPEDDVDRKLTTAANHDSNCPTEDMDDKKYSQNADKAEIVLSAPQDRHV